MASSSIGVLLALGVLSLLTNGARGQNAEFEREEIDVAKTKCEVCKTAVKILFKEVEKTDPAKVIEVGSFRLRADGATQQRKVPYRGSEIQLHDLLDDGKVCGGMKDYVPVTDKETGLPLMINMVEDIDKLSRVKFNPNPDFNSKMHTLCEELMGDHEDALMSLFKSKIKADGIWITPLDFGRQFCIQTTKTCPPDDAMEALRPKDPSEPKSKPEIIRSNDRDREDIGHEQWSGGVDSLLGQVPSSLRDDTDDDDEDDDEDRKVEL